MTLQTPGATPQAGEGTAPQAGESAGSTPPQDGNAGSTEQPQGGTATAAEEAELPEAVREMLRNYRQENRSLRERLRSVEQAQQPKPADGSITAEEFQRREAAWQDRLRQQGVRSEVAMASAKMGIVDPEAAFRLLDTDDLDFDEKGAPTNVESALKGLVRDRPWLVNRRGSADGGAGAAAPRSAATSMNDALRAATGRGPRQ